MPSGTGRSARQLAAADRLTAFDAFAVLAQRSTAREPTAAIRLGDGEGVMLAYPRFASRGDVDDFLTRWLRTTAVPEDDVLMLCAALKDAVAGADIVGVPRRRQVAANSRYAMVEKALAAFELIAPGTQLTHAVLHRLLQHALLFRPLLADAPFLGLVSCRNIAAPLRTLFRIGEVRWYGVRGALDNPGSVATPHFPDGFEALRRTLTVPFRGALFLVGAGVFGKIYCHWIKARGGIAIDIGGMFDSWAGVGRGQHPVRRLDVYTALPRIAREAALRRYNDLLEAFALDCPPALPARLPPLPAAW